MFCIKITNKTIKGGSINTHIPRNCKSWFLYISVKLNFCYCIVNAIKSVWYMYANVMPWSHLCVKPPRMGNARQMLGHQTKFSGAVLSRSATYYAALPRVSSLPPRRRHDSRKGWFYLSPLSRGHHVDPVRARNYHVLPHRCRICHELASYHPKSLKWLYVAHTRRLYAKVWPRHNMSTYHFQFPQQVVCMTTTWKSIF